MRIQVGLTALGLLALAFATPPAQAQDAGAIVKSAASAMGADKVKTLRYSGSGSVYLVNENDKSAKPKHARLTSFIHELDLGVPSSRIVMTQVGVDPAGEQTRTVVSSGTASWETQPDIWLTPYGFLKGAAANNADVEAKAIDGKKFNVVTFRLPDNHEVTGFIDSSNVIDRIQTRVMDPVLGDTLLEAICLDYKDFDGVKFPSAVVLKRNGDPSRIVMVSEVKTNVPVASSR